jgi:hypothetical protein
MKPGNFILKLPNFVPIILDLGIATLPETKRTDEGARGTKKLKVGLRTAHFKTGSVSKGYTLADWVTPLLSN